MAGKPATRQSGKKWYKAPDFLKELADFAQGIRDEIANASELGDFDRSPQAVKERATRAKADFRFFCTTYFPHRGRAKPSLFHEWTFTEGQRIADGPGGERLVIAAPRGNAKSTFWTELFVLWCVLTRRRRYPVILSDAIEVAAMMLEGIKTELEVNPRLALDFPDVVGQGPVWQVGVVVTANGAKIQCGGAGKRIRGARHGAQRPDLVVLDDIENDDNVKSPEQRDKREAWIDKAVEPLGPPDGSMDMIYVGTVLHLDAVLSRKLKDPTWSKKIWQAVITWPDRMDLWEQWEEAWRNDGKDAAEEFYQANHAELERGAKVLWPEVQPLKRLMTIRARIKVAAFNSEYQNSPMAEDATFTAVKFWVHLDPGPVYFGALDPSLGKQNKARDPSALLVGAFYRKQSRLDVVKASIRRRLPTLIIADAIALQREFRCALWFVEAVQFQEFLRTELMKAAVSQGVPLPAKAIQPHADKDLRIESLQPPMEAGLIRLHPSQSVLLEQLQAWPQADHDDGPDCLEMLWTGAVKYAGAAAGEVLTSGDRAGGAGLDAYAAGMASAQGSGGAGDDVNGVLHGMWRY